MQTESQPIFTKEKNILRFWYDTVRNELDSARQNMACFDRVLFVAVSIPGQRNSEQVYEVEKVNHDNTRVKKNEPVIARFKEYFDEFKKNTETTAFSGTPIETWPLIDIRYAAQLKSLGIFSVEALASLNDIGINKIGMGGRKLVQQANDWITQAKDSKAAMNALAESRAKDQKIAELQSKLDDLASRVEALTPVEVESVKRRIKEKTPELN